MSGEAVPEMSPIGPTYFYQDLERKKNEPYDGSWLPHNTKAALITEFIGPFVKVLTVSLSQGLQSRSISSNNNATTWDPMAVGAVLMVMVYAGAHISGAHYNPAVSWGVYLRGKIDKKRMLWYWLVQILGSFFGATLGYLLTFYAPAPTPGQGFTAGEAFFAEMIYAMALVVVVLCVSTTKATENNSYFGLAQGFTYLAGAYSIGPISGAVLNPAAATGMYMWTMFSGHSGLNLWIYWFAPCVGGTFAALIFRLMNPQEFEKGD